MMYMHTEMASELLWATALDAKPGPESDLGMHVVEREN